MRKRSYYLIKIDVTRLRELATAEEMGEYIANEN